MSDKPMVHATANQIKLIKTLFEEMNWTAEDIEAWLRDGFGITKIEQLPFGDASGCISELLRLKRQFEIDQRGGVSW